jgi:hypothetical protein
VPEFGAKDKVYSRKQLLKIEKLKRVQRKKKAPVVELMPFE